MCIRCNYNTPRRNDMEKHLKKILKCNVTNIEILSKSDDEIYNISMKSNKVINNFICEYCDRNFSRKDNLKVHKKGSCKNIKYTNNNCNNNCNNQINIENQLNINNTVIINQNINLTPFDENWIVNHIDILKKYEIMFTDNKFTNLLEQIFLNKDNLNIILDKNSKSGFVYKNNDELYVNMKLKEIIDKSITKLYNQLNEFFEENKTDEYIQQNKDLVTLDRREKYIMESKYKKYNLDTEVRNKVTEILSEIIDNNKKTSIEISNMILNTKKKENNIGY